MPNFVAIDFETANAKRCSACSVGVVVVEDGEIIDTFQSLIKPHPDYGYFRKINVDIHGITEEMVKDAPEFDEVWSNVAPLIKDNILVAHNASFDCSVIRNTIPLYDIEIPDCKIACSYAISKTAWPNLISYTLPVVADHHGISFYHHNALEDAEVSAKLILEACKEYQCTNLEELEHKLQFYLGYFQSDKYKPSGVSKRVVQKRRGVSPELTLKYDVNQESDLPLYDTDIAITGTLRSMTRETAFELIKKAGGRPRTTVSKNTEYLVMGIQDYAKFRGGHKSSKTKKAEAARAKGYPIEIISEKEFLNLFECDIESVIPKE